MGAGDRARRVIGVGLWESGAPRPPLLESMGADDRDVGLMGADHLAFRGDLRPLAAERGELHPLGSAAGRTGQGSAVSRTVRGVGGQLGIRVCVTPAAYRRGHAVVAVVDAS